MHLCAKYQLGLPQNSADAFTYLREAQAISPAIASAMTQMTGFRNVAVHGYKALSMDVVQSIVEQHLGDFNLFTAQVMGYARG